MIYVTHDQMEAMTLADRIVVLNGGQIEQIGAPVEKRRENWPDSQDFRPPLLRQQGHGHWTRAANHCLAAGCAQAWQALSGTQAFASLYNDLAVDARRQNDR